MQQLLLFLIPFLAGMVSDRNHTGLFRLQQGLRHYLLYFGLPLVVLISINGMGTKIILRNGLTSLIIVLAMTAAGLAISLFTKQRRSTQAALFLCTSYGNTAYIGIPLMYAAFGDSTTASIFTIVALLIHLTLGVTLAKRIVRSKQTGWHDFRSLLILTGAAIIGATIKTPPAILISLGGLTTPIASYVVGTHLRLEGITANTILHSLIKPLAMPLVILPFILVMAPTQTTSYLLLASLPPAFINTALAKHYNLNDAHASALTSIGTLLFGAALLIFMVLH